MTTGKAIITDEDGQAWLVLTNDPAWPSVSLLRKAHRTVIILPRVFIVRQVPVGPEFVEERMQRLGIAVESTTDAETFALVSTAFQRATVLYDCLRTVQCEIMETEGK